MVIIKPSTQYLPKPIEREPLLNTVVKIQEEVKIKSQMLNKENLLSERDQMLEQYELKQYMEGVEQKKKTLQRLADKFPVLQGHMVAEAGTDADTIIQSINDNRIKTVSAICGFFKGSQSYQEHARR